jgi:hypothetical protein
MAELPLALRFLAAWIGTWVARNQECSIAYLREENRIVLKTARRISDEGCHPPFSPLNARMLFSSNSSSREFTPRRP